MRHKEKIPEGQFEAYIEARQFFRDFARYRRKANPPVTQVEIEAAVGIHQSNLAHLEKGHGKFAPRTVMGYARRIYEFNVPISGADAYLGMVKLAKEIHTINNSHVYDSNRNREYQSRWRARHPETERQRQEAKRKKNREHRLVQNEPSKVT